MCDDSKRSDAGADIVGEDYLHVHGKYFHALEEVDPELANELREEYEDDGIRLTLQGRRHELDAIRESLRENRSTESIEDA